MCLLAGICEDQRGSIELLVDLAITSVRILAGTIGRIPSCVIGAVVYKTLLLFRRSLDD